MFTLVLLCMPVLVLMMVMVLVLMNHVLRMSLLMLYGQMIELRLVKLHAVARAASHRV
jgi:hypothetical protein